MFLTRSQSQQTVFVVCIDVWMPCLFVATYADFCIVFSIDICYLYNFPQFFSVFSLMFNQSNE